MAQSKGYRDLIVYQKAFAVAMKIFHLTKKYPRRKNICLLTKSGGHRGLFVLVLLKPIAKGNTKVIL